MYISELFWNFLSFIHNNRIIMGGHFFCPPIVDDVSYSDSKDKASAFNTFFSSVFNTDTSISSSPPTSPYADNIVSTLEIH